MKASSIGMVATVAALAAVLLLLGRWSPEEAVEVKADAVPSAGAPVVTLKTRAHIPRPRVVQTGAVAAPAEIAAVTEASVHTVGAATEEEPAGGGVDPKLPLTPEALQSVADRMRPSIAACVEAWTVEEPQIKGRVVLAFQLGAEGVQDAWVVEQEAVPAGVLGCFSAAVYEQDWPAAPGGVEVTFPFTIEAGLVPDEGGGPPVDRRGEVQGDGADD